jgi:predicted transcriptional regulator
MAETTKGNFDEVSPILDDEDAATLAAIDRGIQAADEGQTVSLDEARQQMREWLTRSSSPKTR